MDIETLLDKPLLRILRNAVATVKAVSFIVVAVAAGAGIVYVGVSYLGMDAIALVPFTVLLVVTIVAGTGAWYYIVRFYDPPFCEILDIESRLVVESVDDHHRYTYTKRQTIRATRGQLRLIEFRAHWTGRGSKPPQVTTLVSDQVLLNGQRAELDGRVHRWIYPFPPVGRGQTLKTGIRQIHEDDVEPQRPYFRDGGGRYKTRNLVIIARFALDEDPSPAGGIWDSSMPVGENNLVGSLEPERLVDRKARTVDYIVKVDSPKKFHSYGVSWEWPHQESDE